MNRVVDPEIRLVAFVFAGIDRGHRGIFAAVPHDEPVRIEGAFKPTDHGSCDIELKSLVTVKNECPDRIGVIGVFKICQASVR